MRRNLTLHLFVAGLVPGLLAACADDPSDDLSEEVQEVVIKRDATIVKERNAAIAAGRYHSCEVRSDGSVWCWGANSYGQLGNGTTTNTPVPVRVSGISTAVAVTAGHYHSCAALANGQVRCWGRGDSGQLGNGSTANRLTPVTVSGLTDVTSVSAGSALTCASLGSGQARCWGLNTYGGLGNGTLVNASTPQTVGSRTKIGFTPLANVAEVEAGVSFACARLTTGGVRCWGRNQYGQLGNGTTTQRTSPVAVANMTATVVDLSVGDHHACVATGGGRAWCWGFNLSGGLGDGTQIGRTTPVQMERSIGFDLSYPIIGVSSVSAGMFHTCVISSDDIWCTGSNDYGQLGMNQTGYVELLAKATSPVIGAEQVASGGYHTCVRRPGGAIVCVGRDNYGQVGGQGRCPTVPTATIPDDGVQFPNAQSLHLSDGAGPLYYTNGNAVEIVVETTGCAQVSQVDFTWGPIEEDDPIEPSDGLDYEVLSTLDRADGVREIRLRIDFQNAGNGRSYPVRVHVASPAGNTASAGFTLAEVLEADPEHTGYIDVGRDEIFNEVLQAMYEKYGDGNYWTRTDAVNFYEFDYEHLDVQLHDGAVYFQARTKADLISGLGGPDDACNPTADVFGFFKITLAGNEPVTTWVEGPSVSVDFPLGCDVFTLWIDGLVGLIVAEIKDDNIGRKIAKRVAALAEYCPQGNCELYLDSVIHETNRVRIKTKKLAPSVTYRQAYISSQLAAESVGDPMRRGIALPTTEDVVIVSGGVAQACSTTSCDITRNFGPSGLFNWNWEPRSYKPTGEEAWGAHPPILDPWPCGDNGCAYFKGRHDAWLQQRGMQRSLAAVRAPNRNVGALLGRLLFSDGGASNLKYLGDHVCNVPAVASGSARLVVGRNDISATGPYAGEYGTGDAIVTLAFPGFDIGRACAED